jgi:hypothetical protein
VSFAATTLYVASQPVFIVVYFIIDSVQELLDTPLYSNTVPAAKVI